MRAAQADVAVGAEQVESRVRDVGPRKLAIVSRIPRDHADLQSVPELGRPVGVKRLAKYEQREPRVVENLEEILGRSICGKLEPKPREPVAGTGRVVRQLREGFGD